MEKSERYLPDPMEGTFSSLARDRILHSAYFQCVASTADSMIRAGSLGLGSPIAAIEEGYAENIDATIELAIAFTDRLIEKVGEKF